MQDKLGVQDRGPGAIQGVRDKGLPRMTSADAPQHVVNTEEQYVFADQAVDIGDGKPLAALQFVRMKMSRALMFAEVARRERKGFVICPVNWHPGR